MRDLAKAFEKAFESGPSRPGLIPQKFGEDWGMPEYFFDWLMGMKEWGEFSEFEQLKIVARNRARWDKFPNWEYKPRDRKTN